jgi:ankyrin repeat protein
MSEVSTRIIKSTHGKLLLRELHDRNANFVKVIEYISKDQYSGRYKDSETNNNAYHLLLSGDFDSNFVLLVLRALLEKCPKGVQDVNNAGLIPLHVALKQRYVIEEAVLLLIQGNLLFPILSSFLNFKMFILTMLAFPLGAKVLTDGYIALFFAVMRDDASYKICEALYHANPQGPSTKNRTNSYPLHFACKRIKPNLKILKLLIDAYPSALLMINAYGWHPLHCLCAASDNVSAAQLVYESCPEAIQIQGLNFYLFISVS